MKYGKGKTKTAGKKAVGIRRQLRRVFGLLIGFLIIVEVASFVLSISYREPMKIYWGIRGIQQSSRIRGIGGTV